LKRPVNTIVEIMFTMFEFNLIGKKRIERSRRRHFDTLLATRCR